MDLKKRVVCYVLCAILLFASCSAQKKTETGPQAEPSESATVPPTELPATEGTLQADKEPSSELTSQAERTSEASGETSTQKSTSTTATSTTKRSTTTTQRSTTTQKETTTQKPTTTAPPTTKPPTTEVGKESEMLRRVNAERTANGLGALQLSEELNGYARIRAQEIAQEGHFSHTRPDGSSAVSIIPSYRYAGENIAYGYPNVSTVMDAWMDSDGHRANILGKNFTQLGVGCYRAPNGALYWVQLFKG